MGAHGLASIYRSRAFVVAAHRESVRIQPLVLSIDRQRGIGDAPESFIRGPGTNCAGRPVFLFWGKFDFTYDVRALKTPK